MQDRLTKHFSHGFTANVNFTWAKIMNRDRYLNNQDSLDQLFRYEDQQPNKLLSVAATYQVPTLLGHSAWQRSIFEGWEVNSVIRSTNGLLVASPSGATLITNPKLDNSTNSHFFNNCYITTAGAIAGPGCTAASVPAFRQNAAFTLNSIGPYLSGVRNKVSPEVDASIFKRFRITESTNFEIRGEFFNVLNTARFGAPNTTLTSSQFGIATPTQSNDPRIGQLTARINF